MSELDLIETDRLVLSGWRRDQIEDLVRLHGDPIVARYLGADGLPWSRAAMEAALDEWIKLFETRRLGKLRVTRKADGMMVGRAGYGIYARTGEPEIGYSLYPQYWGNGYAFEAASALRDWLFRETDAPHFIGMVDMRNEPSMRVLDKIGMSRTHVGPYDDGRMFQFHMLRRPA